jgi:hypothetical protein
MQGPSLIEGAASTVFDVTIDLVGVSAAGQRRAENFDMVRS